MEMKIQPGQQQPFHSSKTFLLDNLPYFFGAALNPSEENYLAKFNEGCKVLLDSIWEAGGFRFAKTQSSSNQGASSVYMYCHCCQDSDIFGKPDQLGKVDRLRMQRFPCKSNLTMNIALDVRTLTFNLDHIYHLPYFNKNLSNEVLESINGNISSTPSKIFNKLMASTVPGIEIALQSQVYYRWQQGSSCIWRLNDNQLRSAQKYLQTRGNEYETQLFHHGNVRALVIFVKESLRKCSTRKELVMNSTYGINSSGSDLFAVLAENDCAGVPLAYMFVAKEGLSEGGRRSGNGAMTAIITAFLSAPKNAGFDPTFFGTDKDFAENLAVALVFP